MFSRAHAILTWPLGASFGSLTRLNLAADGGGREYQLLHGWGKQGRNRTVGVGVRFSFSKPA